MASIVEAIQDTVTGTDSWGKMLVCAVPVYLSYYFYKTGNLPLFYILVVPTALFMLALMSSILYNIRNCTNIPFPSLNPIRLCSIIMKGFVALGPMTLVLGILGFLLTKIPLPGVISQFQVVYEFIIWLLCASILLTAYLIFSATGSVVKPYNYDLISKYCVDVLMGFFFMLIKFAVVNLVFVGFVYYVFFAFKWTGSPILEMLYAYFVVMNLCSMANYLAQVFYEAVPGEDKEEIII